MKDLRGRWTKEDRDLIWKDYIENKIYEYFDDEVIEQFDLSQAAPCPLFDCEDYMLKAQYQGAQPDKEHSWDIDHLDNNPTNNNLDNLIPMHPWCNKFKSSIRR